MIIYKATNTKNNKVYIGQTINTLEYRKSQHIRDCRRLNYYNNKFHNAIKKYGIEVFIWEIICECSSIEELNDKEKYYISYYDSVNNGYNLKLGGENGGTCCDETRRKISITSIDKWNNPEIATKMKQGLIKATKVWSEKCKNNFVARICPICKKEFTCKPYDKKIYCSLKCAAQNPINQEKRCSRSNEVVHSKWMEQSKDKLRKINLWVKENKKVLKDIKWNKLNVLNELCLFLGIKDSRTLAKLLDCANKKEIVLKLIEISKNIC